MMRATAVVDGETLRCEKPILLQSQPLRDRPSMTNKDVETKEWITQAQFGIMDWLADVYLYDDPVLYEVYQQLDVIDKGYEELYGFDQLQIEQIKWRISGRLSEITREYYTRRQLQFE